MDVQNQLSRRDVADEKRVVLIIEAHKVQMKSRRAQSGLRGNQYTIVVSHQSVVLSDNKNDDRMTGHNFSLSDSGRF